MGNLEKRASDMARKLHHAWEGAGLICDDGGDSPAMAERYRRQFTSELSTVLADFARAEIVAFLEARTGTRGASTLLAAARGAGDATGPIE